MLDIHYYENIDAFFDRNQGEFYYFTTKGQHIYSDVSYPNGAYLVFGREDAGLDETLLYHNPDTCVRLPMIANEHARSLNLSNTVAIAAYEVLRQWRFPDLKTEGCLTKYQW